MSLKSQNSVISGIDNIMSSNFFQNYGNYIGYILSIIWTFVAIYLPIYIKETENKIDYQVIIFSILIMVINLSANVYFFYKKNKTVPEDEKIEMDKKINSTYANITLIPIYLIILMIMFFSVIRI